MNGTVVGDFILASGPGCAEWLRSLPGFETAQDGQACLAVRGAARTGRTATGVWVALADLVEGALPASESPDTPGVGTPGKGWRGRFAMAAWDSNSGSIEACTDHFGSLPLYWYRNADSFAVATDLRLLLRAPGVRLQPDLVSVYHYLNFACIPAPRTICQDIHRIEPATTLRLQSVGSSLDRYYLPEYSEELHGDDAGLARQLRDRIVGTVQTYRPAAAREWGCFLSGGTDSSSIVSILARQGEKTVQTCSIGFEEAGYDELEFARIASEACGAHPHLDKVDRSRAMLLIEDVLTAYDQPFGNASAVPTLACAQLGGSLGFTTMLGGDGGDEIFGGNERYAKDKIMEAFYRLPSPLKAIARGVGGSGKKGGNLLLNRVRNFTERGSLPNPDRFYTDDSFASDYYDEVLTAGFREKVGRDASLDFMRGVYARGGQAEPLHRIMRLDLQMAIAQNDLVKVHWACRHHGVTARFPYIDPELVAYAGRLPARYKVRRLKKRYLFKLAMQGILPPQILSKPKQGFGLPIAVWMKEYPPLRALVEDVLLDQRTIERGWIEPAFVSRLLQMHMAGGWDHSAAIWHLLVLELWMRRYMDGRS